MSSAPEPPWVTVDSPAAAVRRVRIGNERHRGALSAEVLRDLERALTDVPDDVRCLLITGTGTVFSAGYDLRAISLPPDPAQAELAIAPDRVAVLELIEAQPLPVVAALNGPALGGGLELALAADVRLAVPEACLGAPAGRLGLVYSPAGLERIMAELPFAVGAELFLAAGTLSAERAHQLGLVSRIVEPASLDQVAVQTAAGIAELSPLANRANRLALHALRRGAARMRADERERLAHARTDSLASLDFSEGVRAFRERRPPRFTGR